MQQWIKEIDEAERGDWEERLEMETMPGVFLDEDWAAGTLRVSFCGEEEVAEDLRRRFGGELERVEERDWVLLGGEAWKGRWLEAGASLVVALDEDEEFLGELERKFPERRRLVVPPELAFGTGDHETTAACLEVVQEFGGVREAGWSLLDLGTGTGILAMTGVCFGAGRVVATELDERALAVAERNRERNRIPPGAMEFRQEDVLEWVPEERFDLICANLYAEVLGLVIPVLPRALRERGWVCLSGILEAQEGAVKERLGEVGLRLVRRMPRGKWVTLLAEGSESAEEFILRLP